MSEVVAGMTADEAWAAVDQSFPLPDQAWRDVMSLDAAARDQAVRDMIALGGLSWAKQPGALARLEAALNVAMAIANPVGAVAGGATSVATMIATFKGI